MSFDAITLKFLLLETKKQIAGRTVDKILEHRAGEFGFVLRNENGPSVLLVSINPNFPAFFHSETHKINFNNSLSNYQLLLKKHLEGARVMDLRQLRSDRILAVYLLKKDSFSETGYILFFEFMGKHSNSFLYEGFDDAGALAPERVAGALNFSHNLCDFIMKPSKQDITLAFPKDAGAPGGGAEKNGSGPEAGPASLETPKDLIGRYTGLSPFLCEAAKISGAARPLEEIAAAFRAGELENLCETISRGRENKNSIFHIYNTALYSYGTGAGKRSFVYPFDLSGGRPGLAKEFECETLNECWARFYIMRDAETLTSGLRARIAKLRAAAERKKSAFACDLAASDGHKKYSEYGSLIISAIGEIKCRGDNDRNLASIEIGGEAVPLEPRLSVSENAQRYFKLARRLRAKNEQCRAAISKLDAILADIEKCSGRLDSPAAIFSPEFCSAVEREAVSIAGSLINDKRALKKFLGELGGELKKFRACVAAKTAARDAGGAGSAHASIAGGSKHYRQFETADGFQIFVGRSDAGNDYILSKIAGQQDYWLHVKDFRGSSVIVKTPKNADPEAVERAIAEAALYAAHYSQGRNATRIFVSCAMRKYVKKVKRVAGKVTYSNETSILVDIARLEEKFGRPEA